MDTKTRAPRVFTLPGFSDLPQIGSPGQNRDRKEAGDPDFEPRVDKRLMVTPAVRNYKALDTAFRADRKLGLGMMPRLWKRRHFRQLMHVAGKSKMKMPEEDRTWLREIYREPNELLSKYLQRGPLWK